MSCFYIWFIGCHDGVGGDRSTPWCKTCTYDGSAINCATWGYSIEDTTWGYGKVYELINQYIGCITIDSTCLAACGDALSCYQCPEEYYFGKNF